jgi:hypothetical protein
MTLIERFEAALACGPFTAVGGYPIFFLMADGETLSHAAALENAELIRSATRDTASALCRDDAQWEVVAIDINWEDGDMRCAHTYEPIPCAYSAD